MKNTTEKESKVLHSGPLFGSVFEVFSFLHETRRATAVGNEEADTENQNCSRELQPKVCFDSVTHNIFIEMMSC